MPGVVGPDAPPEGAPADGAPASPVVPTSLEAALGDRYRLLGLLGRGGMATVYRAQDLELGREVAVKVADLQPAAEVEPGDEEACFVAEARALAAVDHPNVVAIHQVGRAGGYRFLVMPLVIGRSLDRLCAERRYGLALDEVLGIAAQIAAALDEVHARGLVHGDVKPANVMITPAHRAVLMDFGLARLPKSVSGRRLASGTVGYMAPERYAGGVVAPGLARRADVYSLGATAYELLTGTVPLQSAHPLETLMRRLREDPPPASSLRPDVPPEVDDALARALRRDPLLRTPSAGALRDELLSARRQAERRRSGALGATGPGRALVVERDARTRADLRVALRELLPGGVVESAGSAEEALEKFRALRPALLLLDLLLPGTDSVDLCAALRRQPPGPPFVLVGIAGPGAPLTSSALAQLGLRSVLRRPIDPVALCEAAEAAVGGGVSAAGA